LAGRILIAFLARASEFFKSAYPLLWLEILLGLIALSIGIYILIAIVQAFRGKEFHYPLIGKWLLRYMQ